jgi:hypothetical protein
MRKKTAPQTLKNRETSSRKQDGLIVQGENLEQSATAGSTLTNRSHRTEDYTAVSVLLLQHNEYAAAKPPSILGYTKHLHSATASHKEYANASRGKRPSDNMRRADARQSVLAGLRTLPCVARWPGVRTKVD